VEPRRDHESRGFVGAWRGYQQQALDSFDVDVGAGDNRSYLVLPPGAGKTMIGLEAARRLGRRTLVLVPNTAVQAQWAAAWDRHFPSVDLSASGCGTERDLASAMNVLTYQSLAVIDDETDRDFRRAVLRVVREGDLAPYQELVYLTEPTPDEEAWVATDRARFADLMLELIDKRVGSMSLAVWLHTRIVDRSTSDGSQLAWSTFERAEPELAASGLRFANDGLIPLPDGARLREQHRVKPAAQDWVNVLTDFSIGHLQNSEDPRDAEALGAIKRILPGLGYRLTSRGVRVATSPVDRVCALSESKIAATTHILDAEEAVLGSRMRALVLCDFERMAATLPASLTGTPLSTQSGSAQLVAAMLAASDTRRSAPLRPLLVTGQTFACPAEVVGDLIAFCAARCASTPPTRTRSPTTGRSAVSLQDIRAEMPTTSVWCANTTRTSRRPRRDSSSRVSRIAIQRYRPTAALRRPMPATSRH
jgi:superfamily II DNA or RNA helicase